MAREQLCQYRKRFHLNKNRSSQRPLVNSINLNSTIVYLFCEIFHNVSAIINKLFLKVSESFYHNLADLCRISHRM